jgi:DNA mismatch repair protein MutS
VGHHSILSARADETQIPQWTNHEAVRDLNLDRIIESVIGRDEYSLRGLFYSPLSDVSTIEYRQDVSRDLETPALAEAIRAFAKDMRTVRRLIGTREAGHHYQRLRWLLDAADTYGRAVTLLVDVLAACSLRSAGLRGFRDYLTAYARSDEFLVLVEDTRRVRSAIEGVQYCMRIHGHRVRVLPFRDEADYGAEVERAFAKFQQAAARDYDFRLPGAYMTSVEAKVLDRVARLHPDVFKALDQFWERHGQFLDPTIAAFDRDVHFYLAYLDFVAPLRSAALPFCYPKVGRSKEIQVRGAFDLALATKLLQKGGTVVRNDFELSGDERILVVTGPNQGGKTTFARMFGQLHYLARLGLPVPGVTARLFLFDRLFTHFDREERLENLTGKLEDDLLRLHRIVESADERSIVILNESLSSTTVEDALFLTQQVLGELIRRDVVGVFVTFLDELSRLGEMTVSMVAMVDPEDPARRTYEIVRRPADGLAYASAIAEKYGVTYQGIKRRVSA